MNLPTASKINKVAPSISMDPSQEVIRLEDVSVKYRVPHERIVTFKEYMIRRIQRKVQYETFLALRGSAQKY